MDENRIGPDQPGSTTARGALHLLLAAILLAVAVLALRPEGSGWAWGSPVAELRWYATGLDTPSTVRQLLGNLGLIAVPAALVVALWPGVGRLDRLAVLATSAGAGIELLQWALPLGRVVSPMDAALNAAGAVAAGLVVRQLHRPAPGAGGPVPVLSPLTAGPGAPHRAAGALSP